MSQTPEASFEFDKSKNEDDEQALFESVDRFVQWQSSSNKKGQASFNLDLAAFVEQYPQRLHPQLWHIISDLLNSPVSQNQVFAAQQAFQARLRSQQPPATAE